MNFAVLLPSAFVALTLYLPLSSRIASVTLSTPSTATKRPLAKVSPCCGIVLRSGFVHLYSMRGGLARAVKLIMLDLPSSTVKTFSLPLSSSSTSSGNCGLSAICVRFLQLTLLSVKKVPFFSYNVAHFHLEMRQLRKRIVLHSQKLSHFAIFFMAFNCGGDEFLLILGKPVSQPWLPPSFSLFVLREINEAPFAWPQPNKRKKILCNGRKLLCRKSLCKQVIVLFEYANLFACERHQAFLHRTKSVFSLHLTDNVFASWTLWRKAGFLASQT